MALNNIRIVLVSPTHPGNVGAVARAMKNMRLQSLFLVKPCAHQNAEARARAAGADDILEGATVCASLPDALADCRLTIATTARARKIGWPTLQPHEAGSHLVAAAPAAPVALVFGREHSGLTNEELDQCQFAVTIPANPHFSSLNLASAVQVLAYEILRASLTAEAAPPVGRRLASHGALRHFYRHLQDVLIAIDFLNPAYPRKLMRRLIRLFNRAQLDDNELNILEGILTAVEQKRTK